MTISPTRTATITALLFAVGAGPASAAPAPVTSGALTWTMANVYETSASANTNRTWLGYTTGMPPLASGTAAASAGASGAQVTPTSPRGADRLYAFTYPAGGGTFDAAARTGTVELRGAVTFASTTHGYTISVEDPRIVLEGATGRILATGRNAGGGYSYDDGVVFELDLSAAEVRSEGAATVIAGMVPRVGSEGLVFPSGSRGYAAGAGPDRTPNSFGAFALMVAAAETAAPGAIRATIPGPRAGRLVKARLARPLTAARRAVRLLRRGRLVAQGSLRGRWLVLRPRKVNGRYPSIGGRYVLTGGGIGRVAVLVS